MGILIDSADVSEVAHAWGLGFLTGVTTNPTLIAKTGRRAFDVISDLVACTGGIVFHQVAAADVVTMEAEADRFLAIDPHRVTLKVPCTIEGARLVRRLSGRAVCAVTAVYSPAQGYLFMEAGARYLIPYVNRAARQGMDSLGLVQQLAAIALKGEVCSVLAASLKSADEVSAAVLAGASDVTLPLVVLNTLADHELTAQALAEFAAASSARRPV